MALTLPVFLLLVFGVMDFGRMFFIQANIQQAITGGARYASTGNHQSGNDPGTGQPYSRVVSINNYILAQSAVSTSMGATLSGITISSVYGGTGSAGGPQDIETVSLTATVPLMTPLISRLFPNGKYSFTSSATIKNEPFPPGQTK